MIAPSGWSDEARSVLIGTPHMDMGFETGKVLNSVGS
jgi:hypothetical protein